MHPEKRCNKNNSTVVDKEFDSLSTTVELSLIAVFFFGVHIYAQTPAREVDQVHSTAKYVVNL